MPEDMSKTDKIPIRNKNIRLFISSTFKDFTEERRILNEEVFPEISRYCEEKGFVFQVVDLRYGVPLEASEDHTIMKICLEEVVRCRNTGYYLNFLMMLGDRYGYTPEPMSIKKEDFDLLIDWVSTYHGELEPLIRSHYTLDENFIHPSYAFHAGKDTTDEQREKMQELFKQAFLSSELREKLGEGKVNEYFLSATGQEIWKGMLSVDDEEALKHIICLYRHQRSAEPETGITQKALKTLLSDVKEHFEKHNINSSDSVYDLVCEDEHDARYFEEFKTDMLSAIRRIADDSIKQYISADISDRKKHDLFMRSYLGLPPEGPYDAGPLMHGREKELSAVQAFLDEDKEHDVCLISGKRGKGKTYLMALLAAKMQNMEEQGDCVICRFVGGTPGSTDPVILVESIYRQLCAEAGITATPHTSYSKSCEALKYVIAEYFGSNKRKVFIIVDAADQIAFKRKDERTLWIPEGISDNVKVIVSSNDKKSVPKNTPAIRLGSLRSDDVSEAVSALLSKEGRTVSSQQMELLLSVYKKVGRPIYIRYLANIITGWQSSDLKRPADLGITGNEKDPKDYIDEVLGIYISGLQKKFGKALVRYTLGYLLISEHGLSERELLRLLAFTPEVMKEYKNYFHARKSDVDKITKLGEIPYMVWSRFYYSVRGSLKEVEFNGDILYDYYHLTAAEAVEHILGDDLIKECRSLLCSYYESRPYFPFENKLKPDTRKVSELTYQYCRAKDTGHLLELIKSPEYISAMYGAGNFHMLTDVLKTVWKSSGRQKDAIATKMFEDTLRYYVGNDVTDPFLERLHSALAFDEDDRIRSLHKAVFEKGFSAPYIESLIKEVYTGRDTSALAKFFELQCKAKRMNSLRRRYSKQQEVEDLLNYLESADGVAVIEDYLGSAPELSDKQSKNLFAELSRMYYEISYVNYLSGDKADARKYMKRSISYARRSNNEISMQISLLVYFQIILYTNPLAIHSKYFLKKYIDTVKNALKIFSRNSSDSENASRWVSNAYVYLVQGYFFSNNRKMAEKYENKYMASSWIRNNKSHNKTLHPYTLILSKDNSGLKDSVTGAIEKLNKARTKGEGISIEFAVLDLYLMLAGLNKLIDRTGAAACSGFISDASGFYEYFYNTGNCTDSMGNMYFKEHIDSEYRKMKEKTDMI